VNCMASKVRCLQKKTALGLASGTSYKSRLMEGSQHTSLKESTGHLLCLVVGERQGGKAAQKVEIAEHKTMHTFLH